MKITAEGYSGQSWKGMVEEIPDSVSEKNLKPQDPGRPTDVRVLRVKIRFLEPTPLKIDRPVPLRQVLFVKPFHPPEMIPEQRNQGGRQGCEPVFALMESFP